MEFTKTEIAEFKAKGRYYTTWRKNLIPKKVKECFYNNNDECSIKTFFPGKNLQYCHCSMYDLVVGDYQSGIKYVNDEGTYYMFWSANSYWANPQSVAVGKAVDGRIYLIREDFPQQENKLNFRIIPEEYINKNEFGFRPRSYNHSIFVLPSEIEQVKKDITVQDVECLEIAYEGVRAFSKLIAAIK